MNKYITCVGDVAVDFIVPYGEMKDYIKNGGHALGIAPPEMVRRAGGTSGNTAAVLAKLGAPVSLVTKFTAGSQGKFLREEYAKDAIDLSLSVTDGEDYQIMLAITEDGERVMFRWRDEAVHRELFRENEIPDVAALKSDIVHIGGVNVWSGTAQGRELARFAKRAKELGCTVSVDLNLRLESFGFDRDRWEMFETIVSASDIVFGSDEEEFGVFTGTSGFEAAAAAFSERFPGKIIVARHGAEPTALLREGKITCYPSLPVRVVNKVGAGDAFDAGFLYAFHKGERPEICVKSGIACAAYAISRTEHHAAPSAQELAELIARQDPQ